MRTRATASLRRPTVLIPASIANYFDLPFRVELDGLRLLGLLLVLGAGVDLEPLEHLAAEGVVLEHAADSLPEGFFGPARQLLFEGPTAEASGVPGVALIGLGLALVTGDVDSLGVDHNDEVAGVEVRRVGCLVLALEHLRDVAGQPSQRLPVGIYQVPAGPQLRGLWGVSLHLHGPAATAYSTGIW